MEEELARADTADYDAEQEAGAGGLPEGVPDIPGMEVPCRAISNPTIPCRTIPYHTVAYHIRPYRTIVLPYHTLPYMVCIPYRTIPYQARDGELWYKGEKVTSITGIEGEDRGREVYGGEGEKVYVAEENNKEGEDVEEITPIKSMSKIKSISPIKSIQKIKKIQEVKQILPIPEHIARKFIKKHKLDFAELSAPGRTWPKAVSKADDYSLPDGYQIDEVWGPARRLNKLQDYIARNIELSRTLQTLEEQTLTVLDAAIKDLGSFDLSLALKWWRESTGVNSKEFLNKLGQNIEYKKRILEQVGAMLKHDQQMEDTGSVEETIPDPIDPAYPIFIDPVHKQSTVAPVPGSIESINPVKSITPIKSIQVNYVLL